jgi:hypothetical protein
MLYVVVYGFSDSWAFQYFAWSLPFWFFLPPWFFVSAIALGTAYIYSLYWFVCGNAWLLGKWDFYRPSLLAAQLAVGSQRHCSVLFHQRMRFPYLCEKEPKKTFSLTLLALSNAAIQSVKYWGMTISRKSDGVTATSQPWIPKGEQSGLLRRIAATGNGSLCTPMKS